MLKTLTDARHTIHRNPERGFNEVKTISLISTMLNRVPLLMKVGTGRVYEIMSDSTKIVTRRIALRCELDALPSTETSNVDWKSTISGTHHGCGHDGHMAIMIGTALSLWDSRFLIPDGYAVRIIFQPAEEGLGGARPMIEAGCLNGVDEIYGLHNWQGEFGVISVCPGPLMAHATHFKITVQGCGGHGSTPERTIDPIVAAAAVIGSLQNIVSRNISSSDRAVITVATISGGETHNVIPNLVTMTGTTRDFSVEVFEVMKNRMKEVVDGICEAYGCVGTLVFDEGYPVVVNTRADFVTDSLTDKGYIVSDRNLPIMGGEDFSFYLNKIPGCFFLLGNDMDIPCHNSNYDFNDDLIPIGINIWLTLVKSWCE